MDEHATAPVRILIADDEPGVRHGLTIRLGAEDDLDIAGVAEDGHQALQQVVRLRPDLVLMDLRMHPDGLTATRHLRSAYPGLAVIVLSLYDDPATKDAAITAGASAFVSKHDADHVLLETIRSIAVRSRPRNAQAASHPASTDEQEPR